MRYHHRSAKPLVAVLAFSCLVFLPGAAMAQRHGDRPSGSSEPSSRSEPVSRHDGGGSSNSSPEPAPSAPESPRPSFAPEFPARNATPPAPPNRGGSSTAPRAGSGGSGSGARTGDGPVVGRAIPREGAPAYPAVPIYPGGYYPWGYGGIGFGAYYDGYWGPYDPWYGGYPSYGGYTGSIRLKIKPRDASVYVDGYFVGVVDEFDGMFQQLPIEPGAYTIEIRAAGYETHVFDVRILPDRTTTYEAELTPIK